MPKDDGDNSSLTEILVCTHTGTRACRPQNSCCYPWILYPLPTTRVLGLVLLFICTTSEADTYMCLPKAMAADNVHLPYQALTQSPFYYITIDILPYSRHIPDHTARTWQGQDLILIPGSTIYYSFHSVLPPPNHLVEVESFLCLKRSRLCGLSQCRVSESTGPAPLSLSLLPLLFLQSRASVRRPSS